MFIWVIYILIGLVLLAIGAEGLVRGSSSVALRLGVTPLVVGLTIVAFGTGSPEFIVSIQAALSGSSALALGNVVGSNISNVALILGVAAIVRPLTVRAEVLRREMPVMIAVSAFLWLLLYDGELSRLDGALLAISAVGYTVLTYRLSRQKPKKAVEEEFAEAVTQTRRPVLDVMFILGGLALLVVGAQVLVAGAVALAAGLGIGEAVIGLTIVAIGTSLPELATSAMAAYKNEPDIAFGNAIGSNVLNILAVLGVAAMVSPIPLGEIQPIDLGAMLGAALVLFVLLGRRYILDRVEGSILVIGYALYLYSIVVR